jgi:hypothetical protein
MIHSFMRSTDCKNTRSLAFWTLSLVSNSKQRFGNWICFHLQAKCETTCPSWVGVSPLPPRSPEDGNRYGFQNVVFSACLELRTKDPVQKPSDHHQNPLDSTCKSSHNNFSNAGLHGEVRNGLRLENVKRRNWWEAEVLMDGRHQWNGT